MSFFHASERLCAAPEQLRRLLMSDFPDERLSDDPRRFNYCAAPDHDAVECNSLDVVAHDGSELLVLRL